MAEVQKDDQLGNREDSALFIILVQMFAQQALMHLGKIMNPITKKAERDLDGAQFTIGVLEMLQEKTKGNLAKEEEKLLKSVLTDLRLNYVEESQRGGATTEAPEKPSQTESAPQPATATDAPLSEESSDSKIKFHKKYE
jgi:hypothetical protein